MGSGALCRPFSARISQPLPQYLATASPVSRNRSPSISQPLPHVGAVSVGLRRSYERDTGGLYINEGRDSGLGHITYVLFALGIFTGALTTIAGLIAAYMFSDRRDQLSAAHFDYLISTFWSALVGIIVLTVISILLTITIIGIPLVWLLWLLFVVWYVLRIARGWMRLFNGDYPPRTFFAIGRS